jgi:hypothetical protein
LEPTIEPIELPVAALGAFLLALETVAGPEFSFFASHVLFDEDRETTLRRFIASWDGGYELCRLRVIPNAELRQFLQANLYSRLPCLSPNAVSKLDDRLNEYYGLASTMVNRNGRFHPLLNDELTEVEIWREKDNTRARGFVVGIGPYLVLTCFATRAGRA